MKTQSYEIGMVGLGVMGRNLLLNMADHGYSVAGYDKDVTKVAALRQEAEHRDIRGAESVSEFAEKLNLPLRQCLGPQVRVIEVGVTRIDDQITAR